MAKIPADFNEAFQRLAAEIENQASGSEVIRYLDCFHLFKSRRLTEASLSQAIQVPFEATYAPTSTHALHDLGRLFSGDDNCSLFLRLDGPAIYLVIATVLQFPPCSMLSKIVYFFMDLLKLYVDSKDARNTLEAYLDRPFTQGELAKRRKTILSQLIPRLKALLFDDDKHHKVRRLVAQLIMEICQQTAQGWRVLMEAQEQLLFGVLFSQVGDYVLRMFVSDILRHLLANNYEMHELWTQSSEDVMDFPSAQELNPKAVSKILHTMSALDAGKAFKEESHSRLYHISDINISGIQYHSARSDTIIVIDDHLTLLMPEGGRDGCFFAAYEIQITQETFLENHQTFEKQTSYVKLRWKDSQGYLVLRGKKKRVGEIRLQFSQHHDQNEFCNAFDTAFQRQAQHSWSLQSQQLYLTTPQLQSIVMNDRETSDADNDTVPQSPTAARMTSGLAENDPMSIAYHVLGQNSSDLIIEDVPVASDVFAFSDESGNIGKSVTTFSTKLRKEVLAGATKAPLTTPRSSCNDEHLEIEGRSSPLRTYGKRGDEQEGTIRSHVPARNPALSGAFDQGNDVDYASFLMTASRVNAASLTSSPKRPVPSKRKHQDLGLEKPGDDTPRTEVDGPDDKSTAPAVRDSASTRIIEASDSSVAPRKRLKNTLSRTVDKTPRVPVEKFEPAMAETKKHKGALSSVVSKATTTLSAAGRKSTAVKNVDWDEDLRTDDDETKKQDKQHKFTAKILPRKPLKDTTNTSRVPARDGQNKARKAKKATGDSNHMPPPRSVSPVRRSQRTTTSKPKSYVESPTSEHENLQDNESEQEIARRPSSNNSRGKKKPDNQKSSRKVMSKTRSSSEEKSTEISTTPKSSVGVSSRNQEIKSVIVVPSSDDEDESQSGVSIAELAEGPIKQTKDGDAPNADTQAEQEIEVLNDSYPRQDLKAQVSSAEGDRGFAMKLNNMIAGAPFGNPKQFIHNVNTAKAASGLTRRSSPSPLQQHAIGLEPSEMLGRNDLVETQQELAARFTSDDDISSRNDIAPAIMSHHNSFRSATEQHRFSDTSADWIVDGKLKSAKATECTHNERSKETAENEERSSPAHEITQIDIQQSPRSPSAPKEYGKSYPEADQTFTRSISSAIRRHVQTTGMARSATKQQRVLAMSSIGSLKQQVASPGRLATLTSSNTGIVHFGNSGPLLPKRRMVQTPKARQSPQIDQQLPPSDLRSKGEMQTKQASANTTRAADNRPLVPGSKTSQDAHVNHTDPPPPMGNQEDQQNDFAKEDDSHNSAQISGVSQAPEQPLAPAIPAVAMTKSDNHRRSGDCHVQPHLISSAVQLTPHAQASRRSSATTKVVDPAIRSTSPESLQVTSACVASIVVTAAIPTRPDSVELEQDLSTSRAQSLTHDSDVVSNIGQTPHESLLGTTELGKPVSRTITQLDRGLEVTAEQSTKRMTQDRTSVLLDKRFPQANTPKWLEENFYTEDTPLLQMSTIARSIFPDNNNNPLINNLKHLKNSRQSERSEKLSENKAVDQVEEPSRVMGNSTSARAQPHVGPVAGVSPNVAPQNHHKMSKVKPTSLPAPYLENTPTEEQPRTAQGTTETFNVIRVNRQDSSPAKDSGTLVVDTSTPQAFVQRLHAPTSPIIGIQSSSDAEKTPYLPQERPETVRKGCTDQRRLHSQSAVPFSVQISKRQAPSSLASSNSEEDQSMLSHAQKDQPNNTYPVGIFASMVEDNMLEVVWKLVDRIDAQENIIAKQVEAYHTGSIETMDGLKRNSSAQINYDTSKLVSVLGEQRQHTIEIKAQLAKMNHLITRPSQASTRIEQHKQHLWAMLDDVRA